MLISAFRGFFSIKEKPSVASDTIAKVKTFIDSHKDVDSYIYSAYYRLCYTYYASKDKYKLFYNSALQFLAYTQPQ